MALNLSSYYGLVDAKIRASDKDLPVPKLLWSKVLYFGHELENVHFAIAASACKIGPTDKRG